MGDQTTPEVPPTNPNDVLPIIQDDTQALAPIATAEPGPIKWSYTPSGFPLVIGDEANIVERVRTEMGWPIWYLVAQKRIIEDFKGGNYGGQYFPAQKVPHDTPKVFKIIDNIIGWSVHEAPEENIGLQPVEQSAMFMLPLIPWLLIQKLDNFFRRVAAEMHTEAIVILTYNPNVGGPEGWGVVVPDQENTAAHCKYDADSIVEAKDDDAFMVGSVHSHPGMSAYASGTDHADQADFDGLHITFGWSNSKNQGETEYYAEMQMGGKAWKVEPENIFLDMPEPVKFAEVDHWSKKVKPATPTTQGNGQSGLAPSQSTAQGFNPGTAFGKDFGYIRQQDEATKRYPTPKGWPSLEDNLVIAELLSADEKVCPTCNMELDPKMHDFLLCHHCWNFLALPDMTLEELITHRKGFSLDTVALSPRNTKKPVKWVKRVGDAVVVSDVTLVDNEPLAAMGEAPPLAEVTAPASSSTPDPDPAPATE